MIVFAVAASVATAWSVFLIRSDRIPFNADQAVVSLMATHILDGRSRPLMFWGTHYGGTIEPHLVAAAFAIFGASREVFRATMAALYAGLLVGSTFLTFRFFGRRAALGAALWLALPPFFLSYKGLTSDGLYEMVGLLGLASVLAALYADERLAAGRSATGLLALLGLVAGLGLWVTPLTVPLSAAAALWLVLGAWRRLGPRGLLAWVGGACAGAAPWLVWNLRHGWMSLRAQELSSAGPGGLVRNAWSLAAETLPVFLGAARPNASVDPHESFPGARGFVTALVLLLLLPAAAAARENRRLRLLWGVVGTLLLFAAASGRLVPTEPRFLFAAYPPLAALIGVALARARTRVVATASAAGLGLLLASDVAGGFQGRRHLEDTDESQVTATLQPLVSRLESAGITRAWTHYWAAYRVTFESGERVVAVPLPREDVDRYAPMQEAVRESPSPAVVLLPPRDACFRRLLVERGEPFGESAVGRFAIFYPIPTSIRDDIRRAGALPLPAEAFRVTWSEPRVPRRIARNETARSEIRVRNDGPCPWLYSVRLVASWDGGPARTFATPGRRVEPGATADLRFDLTAPGSPGTHRLTLDLEQADVARFASRGGTPWQAVVDVAP